MLLPIYTSNLMIRHLASADAEPVARLWTDPQVTRFMGGPREYDKVFRSVQEDAAVDPPPRLDLWPVYEIATGALIGNCGLLNKQIDGRDEVELVYVIAVSAWGKGYATEAAQALVNLAFGPLGLARLAALVEPENAASARVAVKVGMHCEKQVLRPSGRTMDLYVLEKETR
jgi:ribosomal-protein-alanine N-acetyltransferase